MEKIAQAEPTARSKPELWASGLCHAIAALGVVMVGSNVAPVSPPTIPVEMLYDPVEPRVQPEHRIEPMIAKPLPQQSSVKAKAVPSSHITKSSEALPVTSQTQSPDLPDSFDPPSEPLPPKPPTPHKTAPPTEYVDRIESRLLRVKFYPSIAKSQGIEGKVLIRMILDRTGNVLKWQLENGSGSTALDKAAIQMIQRASPFPAFPDDLSDDTLEMVVPVEFSLQKN